MQARPAAAGEDTSGGRDIWAILDAQLGSGEAGDEAKDDAGGKNPHHRPRMLRACALWGNFSEVIVWI